MPRANSEPLISLEHAAATGRSDVIQNPWIKSEVCRNETVKDARDLAFMPSLPMPKPMHSAFLAGERAEPQNALHCPQHCIVHPLEVWITAEGNAGEFVPPHVTNTIESADVRLTKVRKVRCAARNEQAKKESTRCLNNSARDLRLTHPWNTTTHGRRRRWC